MSNFHSSIENMIELILNYFWPPPIINEVNNISKSKILNNNNNNNANNKSIKSDTESYIQIYMIYMILFTIFYVFSSPFTGNRELRQRWSGYIYISIVLYLWLGLTVFFHLPVLTYDTKIPVSVFFPLFLVTLGTLSLFEVLLKLLNRFFVFHVGVKGTAMDIVQNSALISVGICVLLANCTEKDLSENIVCRYIYSNEESAPLFKVWVTFTGLMCFNKAVEKLTGVRAILSNDSYKYNDGIFLPQTKAKILSDDHDIEMQPMVSWYDFLTAYALVDLLVYLKVFVGRFDMRTLEYALNSTMEHSQVYDHSKTTDNEDLWLDWMADTGDGFNSTYTISRLLAQPMLNVSDNNYQELILPRAKILVIGGDLAYPTPSKESYEKRLFVPFECALPPPNNKAPFSKYKPYSSNLLKNYDGPLCYCIPGNHDTFDGKHTFLRSIVRQDFLGGWLLPQSSSYFALKLPHNWYLFACDCALEEDIDSLQGQYFCKIAQSIGADARVILCTHQPDWILSNYEQKLDDDTNLSYLCSVIGDRLLLRIAGDIHNYTRHNPIIVPSENTKLRYYDRLNSSYKYIHDYDQTYDDMANFPIRPKISRSQSFSVQHQQHTSTFYSLEDETERRIESDLIHRCDISTWSIDEVVQWLISIDLHEHSSIFRKCKIDGKLLLTLKNLDLKEMGIKTELRIKKILLEIDMLRHSDQEKTLLKALDVPFASITGTDDDDNLIDTDTDLFKNMSDGHVNKPVTPLLLVSGGGGAFLHPTHVPDSRPITFNGTRYVRAHEYPSTDICRNYSILNLLRFRSINFRFDLFGGFTYYFLVISLLPLCNNKLENIINSNTWYDVIKNVLYTNFQLHIEMLEYSTMSTLSFFWLLVMAIGFTESNQSFYRRFTIGGILSLIHSFFAFLIVIIIELALELGMKRGVFENEQSMVDIFTQNFPSARWLLRLIDTFLLEYISTEDIFVSIVSFFDLPTSIYQLKTSYCNATNIETFSTSQHLTYYLKFGIYFWVMATPIVSFIFGAYLYVSVNFLGNHWNEAFSALRIENYKNFLRMHFGSNGDLSIYCIGVDKVPKEWQKDKKRDNSVPSYTSKRPSILVPKDHKIQCHLVDFVKIKTKI